MNANPKNDNSPIGLIVLALALIILVFLTNPISNLFFRLTYNNNGLHIQTTGTIIDYEKVTNTTITTKGRTKKNTSYYPVVEYMVNGKKYKEKANSGLTIKPKIGSAMDVLYNPNNPYESKVLNHHVSNTIIFVIGVILIFFCLFNSDKLVKRVQSLFLKQKSNDYIGGEYNITNNKNIIKEGNEENYEVE